MSTTLLVLVVLVLVIRILLLLLLLASVGNVARPRISNQIDRYELRFATSAKRIQPKQDFDMDSVYYNRLTIHTSRR